MATKKKTNDYITKPELIQILEHICTKVWAKYMYGGSVEACNDIIEPLIKALKPAEDPAK